MGGKKTTKTEQSYSGSGQQWANPYAQEGVRAIMDVYKGNAGNLAEQATAANDFAKTLQGGYTSAGNVGNAGSAYFSKVMNGGFLGNNPYLAGMISATNKDVTDQANSQFTLAGRYGSGAHTGVLASELAEAQNALRYADYGAERDRMTQAAQGSVQADAARAQAQAQAASQALAAQQLAAQIPYMGTESLAQGLNALFSGGTSNSKTVEKSGGLGSALGQMLPLAAMAIPGVGPAIGGLSQSILPVSGMGSLVSSNLASDPRLKENVVKLREDPDGLAWYEFDYLWSGPRQEGVMADQVAELRPWALGPEIDGFMTVDYDKLDMAA